MIAEVLESNSSAPDGGGHSGLPWRDVTCLVIVAGLAYWIGCHPEESPSSYSESEYSEFLVDRW